MTATRRRLMQRVGAAGALALVSSPLRSSIAVIATLVVALAVVLVGGLALIFSGFYHIEAHAPHWGITNWVLETVRDRSIKAHAAGIQVLAGLDDPNELQIGVEHFAAHCAVCHGAPGVPKGDIAHRLYPQPPDLAYASSHYTPAELFWIVKHGIKMTGMPAWSDHSDEELWATLAFLQKLPGMSEQEYAKLVMASMAQGGHHHSDSAVHASAHSGGAATPPLKP